MSTKQHEWNAFLALVPYFAANPSPPKFRERFCMALRHCPEPLITRDALLLRAGLSFFADEFGVDLALMQLIRDGAIRPVVDCPFTFAINPSYPKGVEPCARSESKPVAVCS